MADEIFTRTDPDLLPLLKQLQVQEPIFHRPQFAATLEDFDRLMAPDYWEVGASGRRYGRTLILETLKKRPPVDSQTANWRATDFACRRLGPDTYLLTYTLDQNGRRTRRTTVWRQMGANWQILFHQGTLAETIDEIIQPTAGQGEALRP